MRITKRAGLFLLILFVFFRHGQSVATAQTSDIPKTGHDSGIAPIDPDAFGGTSDEFAQPLFQFRPPQVGFGASYEMRSDQRTGPEIDTDDTSHEFREWLELQENGAVYDPGLFNYTINVRPEWAQRMYDRKDTENEENQFFLPRYFIRTSFLSAKPYSLGVYARRSQNPVTSAFAQRTETETEIFGADLNANNPFMPGRLSFWQDDIRQTGFFDSREKGDNLILTMNRKRENSNTNIRAAWHDKTRSTESGTTEVESSSANLWNNIMFGGDKQFRLISFAGNQWTVADRLDSSFFHISENLTWYHTGTLESLYRVNHDQHRWDDFDQKTTFAEAGIRHLFNDRLTTTLTGNYEVSDFESDSENATGGRLDLDYNTGIPWGTFHALASHRYNITRRDSSERVLSITESITLSTTEWTFLGRENIDIASVTVTDPDGTTIYDQDIDYRLESMGTLVRISRTPFGAIPDGGTVSVTYRYTSIPAYDNALFSQRYELGFNFFSGFSINYSFYRQRDDVISGTPPDNLSDQETHVLRLKYEQKWTSTQLTFEDREEAYEVSTALWRVDEALNFRWNRTLFFTLAGYYGERNLKYLNDIETLYGFRSRADWVPAGWCQFSLEGLMDRVSGDYQDITSRSLKAGLELFSGIWRGKLYYDYINEEDAKYGESRVYQRTYFEIKKDLW